MFKKETLTAYAGKMSAAMSHYCGERDIKVSISSGNSKIGHVLNVSLPAVFTCGHCAQCMHYCYDIRDCRYSNVVNARARNYVLAMRNTYDYFAQIWEKMSRRRKNFYFRFHVGGDIPTREYFDYMALTAELHPNWVIWSYTKEYDIVNRYIEEVGKLPDNLHIMFSEWRGLPMENPHHMPEFRVIFKGESVPDDCTWICPGNCDICKAAGRGCVVGETTYAHEH